MTTHPTCSSTTSAAASAASAWTLATARGTATLSVHPFAPLSMSDREAVTVEGAGLLDFLAPKAEHDVRIADPTRPRPA